MVKVYFERTSQYTSFCMMNDVDDEDEGEEARGESPTLSGKFGSAIATDVYLSVYPVCQLDRRNG